MTSASLRLTPALALIALIAACSGEGAGPSGTTQVTFHLTTRGAAVTPGPIALLSDTLTDGTDTLVIDQVQLVLRDIRFKPEDDDGCEEHDGDNDDSDDDDSPPVAAFQGDQDGCRSFNAGPYLLDLPLGAEVTRAFSVAVDTGTYDELRIKLHKPRDDNGDPRDIEFINQHPDFDKISIRTIGSFNGQPFVFETDVNAEQEMEFDPPLVIADAVTNVDVTIQVDLTGWFADGAGGLVDPGTANKGGPNDHLVRGNIKDSFRAFRDDDRDGHDDDGDDDDDGHDDDDDDGDDGDDGDHGGSGDD